MTLIERLKSVNTPLSQEAAETVDELVEALRLLLVVQDYEAWRRPCHAVDVARAALAKVRT